MKLCEEREHHQIKRRHLKNHDSAFWGPPLELKCGNSISVAMVPNGHRVYSLNPTFFVWHLRMMAKPSLAIFGLIIERWKLRFAEVIQHLKKTVSWNIGRNCFFPKLAQHSVSLKYFTSFLLYAVQTLLKFMSTPEQQQTLKEPPKWALLLQKYQKNSCSWNQHLWALGSSVPFILLNSRNVIFPSFPSSKNSPIMDGERSLKTAAVEVVVLEEREKLTHDNGT